MRRAREVACLLRWARRAQALLHTKRQVGKGLGKWRNRDVSKAFVSWHDFARVKARRGPVC